MEKGTVYDLPRWKDFPFPDEVPSGYEVRRGTIQAEDDPYPVWVWSIVHTASGKHLDAREHPDDIARRVFWVRLFVHFSQGIEKEKQGMRRVILESPYAGAIERNVEYARRALRDSLMRDEAPIASHLLYTQDGVLPDDNPTERLRGIAAGLHWLIVSELQVFYTDLGWSPGMIAALKENLTHAKPDFELRSMYGPLQLPPVTVVDGQFSHTYKLHKLTRIFSDAEAAVKVHPIHVELSGQAGDGI